MYMGLLLACVSLLLGVAKVRVNQHAHDTLYDRYPAIYQQVSRLALETFGNAPKVMSFGSSTGLEALTLAQRYFEKSVIVGVDVDEVTLSQARSTCANVSSRVFMFNGEKTALGALGLYDVIFANSVLCRHPWDPRPENVYQFSLFEQTIATLSEVLRPRGILCIINPNYRIEDTAAWLTHHYVQENVVDCGNFVRLFDRNGTTLPRRDLCVYRKTSRSHSHGTRGRR